MTPSNDIYRVAIRREARRRYPGEFARKKKTQRVHFKKKKKKAQRAALTVLTLALSFYEKPAPKEKKKKKPKIRTQANAGCSHIIYNSQPSQGAHQ